VDVVSGASLGQQSALIYAAPGATIERRAEYRYHASEAGDVSCIISNPAGGLWTIGLLAQCIDGVCFQTPISNTNNYDVRLSVIPMDLQLRPHFVLENGRKTAPITVKENAWAYFSFRLTSPARVWFRPIGQILDVYHVVARRTTVADLASGGGGLPTETDMGFGNEIKDVDFEAGTWVIGVWATSIKFTETTFTARFGYGTEPKDDDAINYPKRAAVTHCPDDDVPAEVGTWDECKQLVCKDCVSSFGKSKGCVFCKTPFGVGSCKRDTGCSVTKQLTMASECELCANLPCDTCIGTEGCNFCDTSNTFFSSKNCVPGECKSPDKDLGNTCTARTIAPVVITQGSNNQVSKTIVGGTIGDAPSKTDDSAAPPALQSGAAAVLLSAVAAAVLQ
jgi:hypothetical protein